MVVELDEVPAAKEVEGVLLKGFWHLVGLPHDKSATQLPREVGDTYFGSFGSFVSFLPFSPPR
jgi:hypothetical protein